MTTTKTTTETKCRIGWCRRTATRTLVQTSPTTGIVWERRPVCSSERCATIGRQAAAGALLSWE